MITPQSQSQLLYQVRKLVRDAIIVANERYGLPGAGEYGVAVSDDKLSLFICDFDGAYVELGTFEIVHD